MAGLDATHASNRFLRTNFPARVIWVILSKMELEQICPSHRQITVAS